MIITICFLYNVMILVVYRYMINATVSRLATGTALYCSVPSLFCIRHCSTKVLIPHTIYIIDSILINPCLVFYVTIGAMADYIKNKVLWINISWPNEFAIINLLTSSIVDKNRYFCSSFVDKVLLSLFILIISINDFQQY